NGNGNGNGHGNGHGHGAAAAGSAADSGPGGAPAQKPGPGIWLEAFTKAVNGTAQEPSSDAGEAPGRPGDLDESDDAWGKGDLK
ncbi:hypothetical protein GT042_02095, partial [Streptomyces sp. SID3212]|nr:hypothetical protein [Streptomyces sp. SID3212]